MSELFFSFGVYGLFFISYRGAMWHVMEHRKQNNIINLPDIAFVRHCQTLYGVNRGVYNTVDCWFYDKGMTDIRIRRTAMLAFLNQLLEGSHEQKKNIKFGHNGLTPRLNEFMKIL
jgi:riboflavin kinase